MTPTREARTLRELAAEIDSIEERVSSLLRLGVSEDNEDMMTRLSVTLTVEASDLRGRAETMDPTPWVPDLFKWARGKFVPVVKL